MAYGNYPDLKKVSKILVVKMRHHGDVLLASPLFSNLKKALPLAQIDAYVYQDTFPMLEGHPAISQFFFYDRNWKKLSFFKKLFKEFSLLLKLRRQKYDLVINLTEGDRGAIVSFFCKSLYRIGYDPKGKGMFGKKRLYTHVVKPTDRPRHTVEKDLDILRCMGIFPKEEDRDLTLIIPKEAHMGKKLKTLGLKERDYIVIHAVSRWRFKCPPPSFMAELILKLPNEKIILTSSPDPEEMKMVEEIIKLTKKTENIHNFSGATSLKELASLLALSKALITVDSVPLHMASALKTPVVAIFGPTSELNWGPWMHANAKIVTQNRSCRPCFMDGCGGSKMSDCLYSLKVDKVIDALNSLRALSSSLIE